MILPIVQASIRVLRLIKGVLLFLLLAIAVDSRAWAAYLDPTFNGSGKQYVDIGGKDNIQAFATGITTQSDNKTIVVGYGGSYLGSDTEGFVIVRLKADGSLDNSFNGTGKLVLPVGLESAARAVTVQSDGKIVVAGYAMHGAYNANHFAIVRLNTNGSLDTSFDGDGISYVPFANAEAYASAVKVQSDGKIVLVGTARRGTADKFAAARLLPNGKLDVAFGSNGTVQVLTNQSSSASALALQSDGKIVLAGSAYEGQTSKFAAVRLNTDGSMDTAFSGDGMFISSMGAGNSAVTGLSLQSGGDIILGGYAFQSQVSFAVVCLQTDGTLNTGFSGGGRLLIPVGTGGTADALVVQSDDKIVLAGGAQTSTNFDMALVRLNPNGSFDNSFDGDGTLFVPLGQSNSNANAVTLRGDGKILLAGFSNGDLFSVVGLNPNGTPLAGFPNGPVPWTVPSISGDDATSLALQSDGKILVAGSSRDVTGTHFSIARLKSDGALDSTFDGDGKRTVPAGNTTSDGTNAIAVQSDGKIVMAGYVIDGYDIEFALVRLNTNGSLDTSFNGNGKLVLTFGGTATCIALQSDGKIVVAGYSSGGQRTSTPPPPGDLQFAVVRLNPNGTMDSTFNGTGLLILPMDANGSHAYGVAVQSNGKIILAGHAGLIYGNQRPLAVARLNADGTLDSSVNNSGKRIFSITGSKEGATAITLQNDSKIVVAGTSEGSTNRGFVVARLNPNGSFDKSFDSDGKLFSPLSNADYLATAMALQKDGKIVLTGTTEDTINQEHKVHFALTRLNPDGSLDNTFNNGHLFAVPADDYYLQGRAVALQSDGRIVVAGYASNQYNNTGDFGVARVIEGAAVLAVNNPRTFAEGSTIQPGSVTFKVTFQGVNAQPVTVHYQTADGTAKAGSDYVAKSGTLTFAPGETTKFVHIDFIGDDIAELSETFFLDLKMPTNATIADSRGSAYIRDDDGPTVTIANAEPVTEGNPPSNGAPGTRPQKFTVTLSAPSTQKITVQWATANGTAGPADYVAASGLLDFAPGQTSSTITVYVKGDTTVEPTETYKINLSNPTYAVLADSQGIAYILNDDASGLSFPPSE